MGGPVCRQAVDRSEHFSFPRFPFSYSWRRRVRARWSWSPSSSGIRLFVCKRIPGIPPDTLLSVRLEGVLTGKKAKTPIKQAGQRGICRHTRRLFGLLEGGGSGVEDWFDRFPVGGRVLTGAFVTGRHCLEEDSSTCPSPSFPSRSVHNRLFSLLAG